MPARAGTDLRLDLQGPPYKKFGVWWANFAVQRGKKVYGSLEVECGVDFKSGELAEAMIEAVANAHETRREAVNKYVVVNEWQYVLWQTARPPDVIQCAHLLHSHA
jgi:hypothetical protein